MGIRNLFARKSRQDGRTSPRARPARDYRGPKNGPLTLAVAGTIIAMIGLTIVNYRLISDPSIACKAFGSAQSSQEESVSASDAQSDTPASGPETCYVPPKVTFYRQLTQADEEPETVPDQEGENVTETDVDPAIAQRTLETPSQKAKESNAVTPPSPSCRNRPGARDRSPLPKTRRGPKVFTVQVGAFTNPAIARQWALKWRARGYYVSLKPVARPRTGVIYRLYLGRFSSEKKADDLVQRLKHKEGISAFRLMVRN